MLSLVAAFSLGLFGSLHCVGMCGPIAAALPYPGQRKLEVLGGVILYNSGRILTYGLLGLIFGILGAGFSLAGFQQIISISFGLLFLVAALLSFNLENTLLKWRWTSQLFFWVRSQLGRFLKDPSYSSLFFVGLANGFLPCGLVYVALAGAISGGSIFGGMLGMMAFGLGTIPLMLLASISGQLTGFSVRGWFKKAYPFVLFACSILLIMRGLQIEIPADWYLAQLMGNEVMCH